MRQLPLYLKLQQLLDGELPEEQYREMSDLEREFRELDEIDSQKADATDEDLELDELEADLLAAGEDDGTDLGALIDRKTELEAQLFGDEEAPWKSSGDEIAPLRDLVETLTETAGGRLWGMGRPRLEKLLKAVDELDPEHSTDAASAPIRRRQTPGSRNVVARRRRQLLAEFRAAWKEAIASGPPAGATGAADGGTESTASPPTPTASVEETPSRKEPGAKAR